MSDRIALKEIDLMAALAKSAQERADLAEARVAELEGNESRLTLGFLTMENANAKMRDRIMALEALCAEVWMQIEDGDMAKKVRAAGRGEAIE